MCCRRERSRQLSRGRSIATLGVVLLLVVSSAGFALSGTALAEETDDSSHEDVDYVISDDTIIDARTGEALPDEAEYAVNGQTVDGGPGDTVVVPFEAAALTGDPDSDITSMELQVEYDDDLEFVDASVPIASDEDVTVEDDDGDLVVEWDPGFLNIDVDLFNPVSWFASGPTAGTDVVLLEFEIDDDADTGESAEIDLTDESVMTSGMTETFSSYGDSIWWGGGDVVVDAQDEPVATFTAESQGGFVAFDEESEEAARDDGVAFPSADDGDDAFQVQGEIYDDGTWESTDAVFPTIEATAGIEADVDPRFGLEGEIDQNGEFMTTAGELTIVVDDNPDNQFSFDIDATTDESNELVGDAELAENGTGSVALVDNEFGVEDSAGNAVIDGALGLPSADEGANWLELKLDIETDDVPDAGVGTLNGTVENETGEPIEDASVDVVDETASAFTDENGTYEIATLPSATHELVADAEGYESATASVDVDQGDVVEHDFTLEAEATQPEDDDEADDVGDDEFLATSTGGFISFDEDNYDEAVEEGLDFAADADGEIQILGEIDDDGEWESTETTFPDLVVQGDLTAQIDAVNGLEGTLDRETGAMTASGELEVMVDENPDDTFTMEIDLTSGESGALEGHADIDDDEAEVMLVDNEFTVDDRTGDSLIDDVLGLPLEADGAGWFELAFDVELDDEFEDGVSSDESEDADDAEDTDTGAASGILSGLGHVFGLVGLLAASGLVVLNLIGRYTT